MGDLASGIESGIGGAVSAVSGAVSKLTSLLPGSPAETGPLSGQGYSLIRGQHLVEDLATGIVRSTPSVESAARDVADLMTLAYNGSAAFDAITSPLGAGTTNTGAGQGGGVSITVAAGAVQLILGDGVDPKEAADAFAGSADTIADALLSAIQRR